MYVLISNTAYSLCFSMVNKGKTTGFHKLLLSKFSNECLRTIDNVHVNWRTLKLFVDYGVFFCVIEMEVWLYWAHTALT